MRDLTSRLRSIVRQDHGGGARQSSARELTYVPDLPAVRDLHEAAAILGGSLHDDGYIVIDRVWPDYVSHGRWPVERYRLTPDAPVTMFDARLRDVSDWARRVVFFDIETTGLSGGAGTVAFLAGCGWFEDDGFRVRQFFLAGPAAERAMLRALGKVFDGASLVVTYNGRTFDVPLMETRWAFHRASAPTDELAHFDMLPPARRLWGPVERATASTMLFDGGDDARSCSLSSLERSVLGFHRLDDVGGMEIPVRYFHFIRTNDAAAIAGVIEHNQHDIVSLAAVTAQALWLAQEGPDACREPREQIGLGRVYEQAGDVERAVTAYERAAAGMDRAVRRHALARLAVLLRRSARHAESAAAWQGVLELADGRRALSPLERRAMEALAIHHEHRARDLRTARRYAERLSSVVDGQRRHDVQHRLGRLDRKLSRAPGLNWDAD